ncbi:MAG: hypothetical protein IT438_06340 [Phycisphaerales bacterium]|nr:hypothetical protein [Phycisphaerales bacterium]
MWITIPGVGEVRLRTGPKVGRSVDTLGLATIGHGALLIARKAGAGSSPTARCTCLD